MLLDLNKIWCLIFIYLLNNVEYRTINVWHDMNVTQHNNISTIECNIDFENLFKTIRLKRYDLWTMKSRFSVGRAPSTCWVLRHHLIGCDKCKKPNTLYFDRIVSKSLTLYYAGHAGEYLHTESLNLYLHWSNSSLIGLIELIDVSKPNEQEGETCIANRNCDSGLHCETCLANGNIRPRCTRIQPIIPTSKVCEIWILFLDLLLGFSGSM